MKEARLEFPVTSVTRDKAGALGAFDSVLNRYITHLYILSGSLQ